jgi:predicted CoA-binding protein
MDRALTPAESARWQNPATITQLLRTARTIGIFGCSSNPAKDSHEVAAYLQRAGYRIVPIAPQPGSILGETVVPTIAAFPTPLDIVDCFRPSAELAGIVHQAVAANARAVWFQLGLFDRSAAEIAEAAGLIVIVDRCTKIEHALRR